MSLRPHAALMLFLASGRLGPAAVSATRVGVSMLDEGSSAQQATSNFEASNHTIALVGEGPGDGDPCNMYKTPADETKGTWRKWVYHYNKNCHYLDAYWYPWNKDHVNYRVFEDPYILGAGMNGAVLKVTFVHAVTSSKDRPQTESLVAAMKRISQEKNGGFTLEGLATESARKLSGFVITPFQNVYNGRYEYLMTELVGGAPKALSIWQEGQGRFLGIFDAIHDFFSGMTLDPTGLTMAKIFFGQLVYSLLKLHKGYLVHRDIKPDNFLLSSQDCLGFLASKNLQAWRARGCYVLYMDFGLSCFERDSPDSRLECQSELAGSPAFMSPELFKHRIVGQKGDVYALGVAIYLLLFNELPHAQFGFRNGQQIRPYIVKSDLSTIDLAKLHPQIDVGLVDMIKGMLKHNSESRWSSARVWEHSFFDEVRDEIMQLEADVNGRAGAPSWLVPSVGSPGTPGSIVRELMEIVGTAISGCVSGCWSIMQNMIDEGEVVLPPNDVEQEGDGAPRGHHRPHALHAPRLPHQ